MSTKVIKLSKLNLIDQIKINKEKHRKAYNKAVIAYKKEAGKQLMELLALNNSDAPNSLDIELDLVKPIDNSEHYDKLIQMFSWEIEDTIILSHDEFKEFVQDENHSSHQATFSNTFYSSSI